MTVLALSKDLLLGLAACSTLTCAAFLRWGWRRQDAARMAQTIECAPPTVSAFKNIPPGTSRTDVNDTVRGVLARLASIAAQGSVQLEAAIQPDLILRTNPVVLAEALAAVICHAMQQAPIGRVLVSGTRVGGHVVIAVMDDGAGTPAGIQQAALRDVAEAIALQGGTLEIEAVPGEGSVITLRLPEPVQTAASVGPVTSRPDAEPAYDDARI